jgi:lysozyme family protein
VADFDPIFSSTLAKEGGYGLTNAANDKGGMTYAGISRRANPNWAGWAYIDRGETPPTPLVRALYREKYWTPLRLDEVRDQRVAESIYEFGFVAGIKVSAKLAQVVVGVEPDGSIGDKSLAALNGMSSPELFLARFTVAKIARYRDIVTKDRSQMKWFLGWVNRALEGAL